MYWHLIRERDTCKGQLPYFPLRSSIFVESARCHIRFRASHSRSRSSSRGQFLERARKVALQGFHRELRRKLPLVIEEIGRKSFACFAANTMYYPVSNGTQGDLWSA